MATKWGVIGAGKISSDFVTSVRNSAAGADNKFVAVGARCLESAQKFASLHCIPTAYGSYEEVARNSNVEVVYVGTVNSQHFPICKLMLEHGKHVLVEKPMAVNLEQTKELIRIAKEKKRFLMEALWSRCLLSYQRLIELIPTIGTVLHVEANLGVDLQHSTHLKKSLGDSSILSLGIYPLNAVFMIYGKVKPLKIAAVGHLNEDGVDIAVSCSLRFSRYRTAQIATSATTNFPCDLVITGTKGIIRVPERMWCAPIIETPSDTYKFHFGGNSNVRYNYPDSSGLYYEAMEVRKCIKEGALESSLMPLKDSEALAEIMEQIRHQVDIDSHIS